MLTLQTAQRTTRTYQLIIQGGGSRFVNSRMCCYKYANYDWSGHTCYGVSAFPIVVLTAIQSLSHRAPLLFFDTHTLWIPVCITNWYVSSFIIYDSYLLWPWQAQKMPSIVHHYQHLILSVSFHLIKNVNPRHDLLWKLVCIIGMYIFYLGFMLTVTMAQKMPSILHRFQPLILSVFLNLIKSQRTTKGARRGKDMRE